MALDISLSVSASSTARRTTFRSSAAPARVIQPKQSTWVSADGLDKASTRPLLNLGGVASPGRDDRTTLLITHPSQLRALARLKNINGSVRIEGKNIQPRDLLWLKNLESISGQLVINNCPSLVSLAGLEKLKKVGGDVRITNNPRLKDVSAFAQLKVGGRRVAIRDNPSLTELARTKLVKQLKKNGFTGDVELKAPKPGPGVVAPSKLIKPEAIAPAEWTMFVHMNADNNLETAGIADVNEMEQVGSIPGKVNVFALVDPSVGNEAAWGSDRARLLYIEKDANDQQISSRQVDVDPSSKLGQLLAAGEVNMGDPALLRVAVEYLKEKVPSKKFAVDLWDHGGGWQGVSFDDSSGDHLEVATELKDALSGLGVDVLSADACLMATEEVANVAEQIGSSYLVGSEEAEPGAGWNYTDLLGRLAAEDGDLSPEQFSSAIVESYGAGPSDNATMSAVNLSKMRGIRESLDEFSTALMGAGGFQNPEARKVYSDLGRYGAMAYMDQIDLGELALEMAKAFPSGPVHDASVKLSDAIAAGAKRVNATGAADLYTRSTGLTIYGPTDAVPLANYPGLGTKWHALLQTYGTAPSPNPS